MKRLIPAIGFVVGITAAAWASADPAQYKDVCTVSPQHCKILKEDDTFRVYEYTAKKGDKVGMHSHPAHVIYGLEAGKTKFTNADGTVKVIETKAGDVVINPPTVHATDHESDLRAIIVELKK